MGNAVMEYAAQTQPRNTSDFFGFEGTVIAGSYDKENGTVSVVMGEALAAVGLEDDAQAVPITASLMTPMVGFQAAPQGGERCTLIATRGGWRAILEHGKDDLGTDAPGAPVGELWYLHAKAGTVGAGNTPQYDSGVKFTNDGKTTNDGLGGAHLGEDGAHSTLDTASGHQVELDDTNQKVTVKSANGLQSVYDDVSQTLEHSVSPTLFDKLDLANVLKTTQVSADVKTIWDASGKAISHVVPGGSGGIVALGDLASNLGSNDYQAVNHSIMTTLAGNADTASLANLQAFATALNSAGIITGGQLTALLAIVVSGWLTKIGVPAGSSIVKIAS